MLEPANESCCHACGLDYRQYFSGRLEVSFEVEGRPKRMIEKKITGFLRTLCEGRPSGCHTDYLVLIRFCHPDSTEAVAIASFSIQDRILDALLP